MYYTEKNPFTGGKIKVVKNLKIKKLQKKSYQENKECYNFSKPKSL